jgi:hypothetical protein
MASDLDKSESGVIVAGVGLAGSSSRVVMVHGVSGSW